MDWFLILLRVTHIGSAVFWVGSAFAFFLFIQPAIRSLGPDTEGAFMGNLTRVQRFPMVIFGATILTVGAGLILYLRDAGGLQLWLGSATGVGFTIGAAAGLVSFAIGPSVIVPSIGELEAIGATLAAEHRPPTARGRRHDPGAPGSACARSARSTSSSSRSPSCSWPRRATSAEPAPSGRGPVPWAGDPSSSPGPLDEAACSRRSASSPRSTPTWRASPNGTARRRCGPANPASRRWSGSSSSSRSRWPRPRRRASAWSGQPVSSSRRPSCGPGRRPFATPV